MYKPLGYAINTHNNTQEMSHRQSIAAELKSQESTKADPWLSTAAVILQSNQNHEHWADLASLIGLYQRILPRFKILNL